MEITIRPHDLTAAAAALDRCARHLEAAVAQFVHTGEANVIELGMRAIAASDRGLALSAQAVHTLAIDITELAGGLRTVAATYPTVDSSAVPQP